MLPLIQSEVEAHGWMQSAELVNFIAVSESTPGPFAINISTYVGAETGGILGALCATFGVVLPSFIIIIIVAKFFDKFRNNSIISGCMSGLKPAVIGMIGSAVISIGLTVFFPSELSLNVFTDIMFYISLLIFAAATILSFRKIHPIIIICLSAIFGIAFGYIFNLSM